jgi:hypothetical protein
MKKNHKEQLAEILQQIKTVDAKPQSGISIPKELFARPSSASAVHNYEALILEVADLREKVNDLQKPQTTLESRVKDLEAKNKLLVDQVSFEKVKFKELEVQYRGLPSAEEYALRLAGLAASEDAAQRAENGLAEERRQLESDRAAFEVQFTQLEFINAREIELANSQAALARERGVFEAEEVEVKERTHLLDEREVAIARLEQSLAVIQSKIGHLKDADKKLAELDAAHKKLERNYASYKTQLKNLKEKINLQAIELAAEKKKSKELITEGRSIGKKLKTAQEKLDAFETSEVFIKSFSTVEWITSQFDDPRELVVPKQVLLIGDGPWPMDDFTGLLQNLEFEVWQNDSYNDIEVVIVGRDNWSKEIVDAQINARDGKSLRVYPQELFVLLLAMQVDPLEIAEVDDLMKFVEDHPVFDHLLNQEFPWPESSYEDGPPATVSQGFDGVDASPLFKLGYTVAQNTGLTPSKRHTVLEETFSEDSLPWCISDEYMDDWGPQGSRKRLRRIAWHLHMLARRSSRNPKLQDAVAKWEHDLRWLKNLYKPVHRFRWPS